MTARGRSARALVAVAALGVLLAACGEEQSVDLEGRSFTATEVRGHDLVERSEITLAFQDGQISAQAGCNTLFGEASWNGGTLTVEKALASTMMACEDALMAQDQWLSEFLNSEPALSIDGGTLTLGDDTTGMTMTETE